MLKARPSRFAALMATLAYNEAGTFVIRDEGHTYIAPAGRSQSNSPEQESSVRVVLLPRTRACASSGWAFLSVSGWLPLVWGHSLNRR